MITTIGNVAPERMKEIVELCADGKFEEALKAHEALLPLMDGLFETSNPILVKEALKLCGFPVGGVRLPSSTRRRSSPSVLRALCARWAFCSVQSLA